MTETTRISGLWGYFSPYIPLTCIGWQSCREMRETIHSLLTGTHQVCPYVAMGYQSLYEMMSYIGEAMIA